MKRSRLTKGKKPITAQSLKIVIGLAPLEDYAPFPRLKRISTKEQNDEQLKSQAR